MAQEPVTSPASPTTPEALLADRQRFWHAWTQFVTVSVISIAILLILMAIFL